MMATLGIGNIEEESEGYSRRMTSVLNNEDFNFN